MELFWNNRDQQSLRRDRQVFAAASQSWFLGPGTLVHSRHDSKELFRGINRPLQGLSFHHLEPAKHRSVGTSYFVLWLS